MDNKRIDRIYQKMISQIEKSQQLKTEIITLGANIKKSLTNDDIRDLSENEFFMVIAKLADSFWKAPKMMELFDDKLFYLGLKQTVDRILDKVIPNWFKKLKEKFIKK